MQMKPYVYNKHGNYSFFWHQTCQKTVKISQIIAKKIKWEKVLLRMPTKIPGGKSFPQNFTPASHNK